MSRIPGLANGTTAEKMPSAAASGKYAGHYLWQRSVLALRVRPGSLKHTDSGQKKRSQQQRWKRDNQRDISLNLTTGLGILDRADNLVKGTLIRVVRTEDLMGELSRKQNEEKTKRKDQV